MYPQPQHYSSSSQLFMAHSPTTPSSALPSFSTHHMRTRSSTSVPLAANNKKRPINADDESTEEELDSSSSSLPIGDGNMDNSCHLMSRKKRRGMIEKRRRDRINNSLHELKRLVPAAFEKQGSAKLEKAEILQMTVDHLRMLHSKGFDAFSFDPHKFATDYHIIGFRECAAEVARYLVVHEGISDQDPLRLRLISHLHCYSAQRELSLKQSTGWNPSLFTTPMYPTPASTSSTTSTSVPVSSSSSTSATSTSNIQQHSSSSMTNANATCDSMNLQNSNTGVSQHNSYGSTPYYSHYDKLESHLTLLPSNSNSNTVNTSSSMPCGNSGQVPTVKSPMSPASFSLGYSGSSTAPISSIPTSPSSSTNSYSYSYPTTAPYFAPTTTYMTSMVPGQVSQSNGQTNAQTVNSVKHYRPWGTELAY